MSEVLGARAPRKYVLCFFYHYLFLYISSYYCSYLSLLISFLFIIYLYFILFISFLIILISYHSFLIISCDFCLFVIFLSISFISYFAFYFFISFFRSCYPHSRRSRSRAINAQTIINNKLNDTSILNMSIQNIILSSLL